ncbi:MAG: hypothetical protein AABO58_11040 [Acidobacteriota bacterium]
MATKAKKRTKGSGKGSGGGKAASLGPRYQAGVASFFAVHMLAEHAAVPVWKLPPDTTVVSVRCEADEKIDDVVIRLASEGILYLQAKRTVTLSDANDSPLRSAMDQFTRQYLHARDRTGNGIWNRPLDDRDRFVLVTRSASSAPLRNMAADLLDRIRELDPAMAMAAAARIPPEERALKILVALVTDAWKAATGSAPSDTDVRAVLRYVHIETLDTEPSEEHEREARKLLRDDILRSPADDENAWTIITNAAGAASGAQSGLNRAELEASLLATPIALKSVRSYAADIAKLTTGSERSRRILEDFAGISVSGGVLHIDRAATQALIAASAANSLLVIGEPGAGKSGAVHDLYVRVRGAGRPIVLLVADALNAPSETALKNDLQLEHDLIDVLRNWRNVEPGLLIIDALDSLRSNGTGSTLRRVIAAIMREGLNWRIVASIRTFDLRRGTELQKLFRGSSTPEIPDDLRDPEFAAFQHLRLPRLSDAELAFVGSEAPHLGAVIASAPPALRELLRVPFNLSLLAQLLETGTGESDLAAVRTQLDLLELYWNERVIRDGVGAPAREVALRHICERMIAKRALRLSQAVLDGADAAALPDLLEHHVLAEPLDNAGHPEGTEIAFAHHVLFDYATARLVCRKPANDFASLLTDRSLPLVIWPSLMMHLHHEWGRGASRVRFWTTVFAVIEKSGVPSLSRVIGPMAAAELATTPDDFMPLLGALKGADATKRETAAKALQFVVMAVHAGDRPFIGAGAGPWAALAAAAAPGAAAPVMYPLANHLLRPANERHAELTDAERANYGVAAPALLAFAWSEGRYQPLVRIGIIGVARTYESDADASRTLLRRVLEPERVAAVGYEELPCLAHEAKRLMKVDPSFVAEIYRAAFAFEDASKDTVPLGGGALLSMVMSRTQCYHNAWTALASAYPAFIEAHPTEATRALIDAVAGYDARKERYEAVPEATFTVGAQSAVVRTDYSAMWDGDSLREDVGKMLGAFEAAIVTFAGKGDTSALTAIFTTLVANNPHAALWRRVMLASCREPSAMKEFVLPMLREPAILLAYDMHGAARRALPALMPHFTEPEREAVEHAILAMPGSVPADEVEYATQRRDRLARALPRELLVSTEMKALREQLDPAASGQTAEAQDAEGQDDDNTPPPGWRSRFADDEASLHPAVQPLEEIRSRYLNEAAPLEEHAAILAAIGAADSFLIEHDDIDPADRRIVEEASIATAITVARNTDLKPNDEAFIRVRELLLHAATSPYPELNPEDEQRWDTAHPSYTAGTRTSAAEGIVWLAGRAAAVGDAEVLTALEKLSRDPVASVRMKVVQNAQVLSKHAPDMTWSILDYAADEELRIGVAAHAFYALRRVAGTEPGRAEQIAIRLLQRFSKPDAPELLRDEATYFLTGRYLHAGEQVAEEWLEQVLTQAEVDPEITGSAVHGIRDALTEEGDDAAAIRERAFQHARAVLKPSARAYSDALARPASAAPLTDDEMERLQNHMRVIETVALEAHYGCGTSLDEERELTPEAKTRRDRIVKRFFEDSGALIDDLIETGFVQASHHVLETLVAFIDLDPRGTFLRARRLLERAAPGGYVHEHEAVRLFIKIAERYLADYRDLLEADDECRDAIVEMLGLFIEAGWPEALRLAFRLGDLFR